MAGPAYQWGSWRFEPSECRLLRDGVAVPLPAKTLDLLSSLIRRAPRLVTKEEILAAVWADATVEEGNIAFHVAALRKVLDEDGGPSAIENVRGRGYRFVHDIAILQMPPTDEVIAAKLVRSAVPVQSQTPAPALSSAPRPPSRHRRLLIALPAVLIIGMLGAFIWRQSQPLPWVIAVEPFEVLNPLAGQDNFPDGLTAYLTARLAVVGITTGERGAATALLSGQLHPKDGGFGVNLQLTRASDGARIWDWQFDILKDYEQPAAGPDDERSRLQGGIAKRAAEGVARYLSLSGAAPVTR